MLVNYCILQKDMQAPFILRKWVTSNSTEKKFALKITSCKRCYH
ncbi:unnamed protein product [Brugia timori]|uniref:Uncharacterized protein n=1 Tax=Brugia timori TaxID=42155 RepID=A0A0R3QD62_9BILA|nr:unnamed protein product [Brugia timori]